MVYTQIFSFKKELEVDLSITAIKPEGNFETLKIPIKKVNQLIVIEAKVDTMIGNFILDTGAPYLILNQTYFRHYQWNESTLTASNATSTSQNTVYQLRVNQLSIQELYYEKIRAEVTDLRLIENKRGVKILGLLGTGLFSGFQLTIDLFREYVYVQKLDEKGLVPENQQLKYDKKLFTVPIIYFKNSISLPTKVAGRTLFFCLDTGAETNVIDENNHKEVLAQFSWVRTLTLYGTGATKSEVLFGTLNKLEINGYVFENTSTVVSDLTSLSEAYSRQIHGMLGHAFLSKGVVSINFVKKELTMYSFNTKEP